MTIYIYKISNIINMLLGKGIETLKHVFNLLYYIQKI